MRLSRRTFKYNKFIDNILMFFMPYHWAYKKGFVDGMEKSSYFGGYTDGYEEAIRLTIDSYKKFFDNPDLRKNGGTLSKDEGTAPNKELPQTR